MIKMNQRPKGIKRIINKAYKRVRKSISLDAASGGIYSGALSGEGYLGGYRDALCDVLLLLNGVMPHRQDFYEDCYNKEEDKNET